MISFQKFGLCRSPAKSGVSDKSQKVWGFTTDAQVTSGISGLPVSNTKGTNAGSALRAADASCFVKPCHSFSRLDHGKQRNQ